VAKRIPTAVREDNPVPRRRKRKPANNTLLTAIIVMLVLFVLSRTLQRSPGVHLNSRPIAHTN